VLRTCKHEYGWPAGLTELGSSGESEQSCNERDLPRYVAL
jgi:hypothetical protein